MVRAGFIMPTELPFAELSQADAVAIGAVATAWVDAYLQRPSTSTS
jgi:hypothetical protein